MNLEQMLSELRLHESNTQALFNALEGDETVADYRKRCQNSEPQYEVFCKSYIIALVKKYVSSPHDSEILLAAYGFLRGFDQINGVEKRRKEYVEAAFGCNKKVTDRNGKPIKALYTRDQPIIQALAAQLTKEVYKQDKRGSLGLADRFSVSCLCGFQMVCLIFAPCRNRGLLTKPRNTGMGLLIKRILPETSYRQRAATRNPMKQKPVTGKKRLLI